MEKKNYLDEEKYQKTEKKLFSIGVGIIIFGVVIAIIIAVSQMDFSPKVSKEELQQQLAQLKPALQQRYNELETQGFKESWDYKNEEGYEMALIDIALDPTYEKCEHSSIYSDNDTTREYCAIKAQIDDFDNPIGDDAPGIIIAVMILWICIVFGGMMIFIAKRRNIIAFSAQQVMPVAKEGIDEMTPTVGKASANIAKEITKGIKEGLEDDKE